MDFGCEFSVEGPCDGTHSAGGSEFAVRLDDACSCTRSAKVRARTSVQYTKGGRFRAYLEPILIPTKANLRKGGYANASLRTRQREACVFRAPRSLDGSKRKVIQITSHFPSTKAPDPKKLCSGSPNTLPAISAPWSHGWGRVDVRYTWSDLRRPFICRWTLNLCVSCAPQ